MSMRRSVLRSTMVATALAAVALTALGPTHATSAQVPATALAASTTSTIGGSINRSEIIDRAQYWVDQAVPYSQSAYYRDPEGTTYRTDCSGMVSMAWHLTTSATTWTLPNYSTKLGSLDDLQPGDALNNINAHVVLFVGWTDSSHSTATIMEEARPGTTAHKTTYSRTYITSNGFKPYRYNKVVESPVTVPDKGMTNVTAVGDLTGDGVTDVVAVETATGDLYRYSGPNYTGGTARVKIGYGWNTVSTIIGIGDLTGDGVADILAVDAANGNLYRYSGPNYNGGSRVQIGTNWDSMTNIVAVGDLTGDGTPDLIAVEKSTGDLYRYSGPGYSGSTRVKIGYGWNAYTSLTGVGDLTGDGVADIVAVDAETGNLYRYSGPNYNGGSRVQIGTNWDTMINLTGVGDLTGDGVPDLLAVNASTQYLYRYSGPGFTGSSAVKIGTNW
ncbi:VCBS repeat-containing protein [Streptomyces actuosus]|uniref:VCBS repeat-containing protein n=1 Tax=Streptomyces actuosus TaxID=1885 RepID=A0ABS2VWD1_STRAS|nr:VCBS repeat-containing protein [Streptomyces actuosus]MBN0047441.1 VCBS repeat-containing protein [Streptomyces actuosus]